MPVSPWVQMMNLQAQNLAPRTEMDQSEGMMSMMPPDQQAMDEEEAMAALSAGADPNTPVPVRPRTAESIQRTIQVKKRGPLSQEQVSDKTLNDDLLAKYRNLSDQALNEQQAGISQLGEQIKQVGQVDQGLNYVPFASMAKFLNPENDMMAAAQAMAPESPQARAEKMLTLNDKLQQRKQEMTKQNLDALAEQIKASKQGPGSLDEMMKMSSIRRNNAMAGAYSPTGLKQAMQDKSQAFSAHKDLVGRVKSDPLLNKRTTQFQNLSNALAAVDKPDITPVQQFAELQQAIRANMGIGGTSGVSERAHTYMDSVGMQTAQLQQFLTGNPQDIIKSHPEIYHHIKEVAKIEMDNIKKQKRCASWPSHKRFRFNVRRESELEKRFGRGGGSVRRTVRRCP